MTERTVVRGSVSQLYCNSDIEVWEQQCGDFNRGGIDIQTMGLTYGSHGVDAVDVVVGPAGGQLVGVLLLLCMDTKTH